MLKPGVELNDLIATKVMGWTREKGGAWSSKDGCVGHFWVYDYEVPFFEPSTDMGDAWQVVEKIRRHYTTEKGNPFSIRLSEDNGHFTVCFKGPLAADAWEIYVAASLSVPHAVCLAALKLVGAEE